MTSRNPTSSDQVAADFASLRSSLDIYNINFTSHRKGIGWVLVLAKKVLRALLTPILQRQVDYNAANVLLASHLLERVEGLGERVEELGERVEGLDERVEGLRQQQYVVEELRAERLELRAEIKDRALGRATAKALTEFDARLNGFEHQRIAELERTILRLQTSIALQERRLTLLVEEARRRLGEPLSSEQLRIMSSEGDHLLDGLYAALEDELHGTREEFKERLRAYVPTLIEARIGTDEMPIVDVGCGRGEWVELLKAEGLRAEGVEANRVLLEECRRHGLEVVESDALGYLRALRAASVGAVTGFHIVEHLPFDGVIKLLDETVRVLKPGGIAIFEAANPENVLVGSQTFYTDPTRRRLLPSSTFKFIAEARGLCRVEVRYLHPYPDACRVKEIGLDLAKRFNEYFYGPRDYAIVGWKA